MYKIVKVTTAHYNYNRPFERHEEVVDSVNCPLAEAIALARLYAEDNCKEDGGKEYVELWLGGQYLLYYTDRYAVVTFCASRED